MQTAKVTVILILIQSTATTGQIAPDHIDPVAVSPNQYQILLENEHVRVLEYQIDPQEKEAWHTHPPKVSYVASGGSLRMTLQNGESFVVEEKAGTAAWMGAVEPHYGENVGSTQVRIALIEIKSLADAPFEDVVMREDIE